MESVIRVQFDGEEEAVRFFKGTSFACLEQVCKDVHGVDRISAVLFRDTDGVAVAISDAMPNGCSLRMELVEKHRKRKKLGVTFAEGKRIHKPRRPAFKKPKFRQKYPNPQPDTKAQCSTPSMVRGGAVSEQNSGKRALFNKSPPHTVSKKIPALPENEMPTRNSDPKKPIPSNKKPPTTESTTRKCALLKSASKSAQSSPAETKTTKSKTAEDPDSSDDDVEWKVGDECEAQIDREWRR
eukprot:284291-Amorphochlora_amoeboformis.AAC.2